MCWQDMLTEIVVSLISGFFGGSIGNVVIQKYKERKSNKNLKKHLMISKGTGFTNNGDVINGNKKIGS